jgi:hypothetical protein
VGFDNTLSEKTVFLHGKSMFLRKGNDEVIGVKCFQVCYIPVMDQDLMLRRKWTFRAHGKQIVLVKKRNERSEHVFMKAFLWALYLPQFPNLTIEVAIGGRYKPDLVAMDPNGAPLFWGEAGYIGTSKLRNLLRRYGTTHFAVAKWNSSLKPFQGMIKNALRGTRRDGPVDLLCFQEDSVQRFMDEAGIIHLSHDDLEWIRI